jgi:hypothetical protein
MLNANKRFRSSSPSISKALTPITQTSTESGPAKITVEYPKENESINSKHYAFKISARIPVVKVEVSLDGSELKACRQAAGHWWFDWTGYSSKGYALTARARSKDGAEHMSSVRRFVVNTK